jgi:hypothetical protein
MINLQERLTELCHEHYAGKIRVIFSDNPRGLTHSEWFDLRKVPFVDLVDFLDSEIVNEDMFKYGHPKNWECQLVVKI